MALMLRAEVLRNELAQILDLLNNLEEKINAGIPGDEIPSSDVNEEVFELQLKGELLLAANRLTSLVEVLNG